MGTRSGGTSMISSYPSPCTYFIQNFLFFSLFFIILRHWFHICFVYTASDHPCRRGMKVFGLDFEPSKTRWNLRSRPDFYVWDFHLVVSPLKRGLFLISSLCFWRIQNQFLLILYSDGAMHKWVKCKKGNFSGQWFKTFPNFNLPPCRIDQL